MSPADPEDRGGREEERRKRPEVEIFLNTCIKYLKTPVEKYFQVEHYKPGAFTGRRAGSEDARRPRSADSGDIALKA